jgi:ABC-type dipeptide/oligopeptide/nickel transport system ATPase subunit
VVQAGKIVDANPWLANYIDIQKKAVVSKISGGQFRCIASDVSSSLGLSPDVVIADEWSAWTDSSWWDSIFSSYQKKRKMIIVGCNALATGSWQIEKRELFKNEPSWCC